MPRAPHSWWSAHRLWGALVCAVDSSLLMSGRRSVERRRARPGEDRQPAGTTSQRGRLIREWSGPSARTRTGRWPSLATVTPSGWRCAEFRRVELMARDDVGPGRLDASLRLGRTAGTGAGSLLGRVRLDRHGYSAQVISLAPLDGAPMRTALATAGVSERLREALDTPGRCGCTQVWRTPTSRLAADGLVDLAECDREGAVVHLRRGLTVNPPR